MAHALRRQLRSLLIALGALGALASPIVSSAAAQAPGITGQPVPERATFLLMVNADTMVVETSSRTSSRLAGEIVVRGQGARFVYQAELSTGAGISKIESAFYRGADTVPAGRFELSLRGDTAFVKSGAAVQRVPVAPGALPMLLNVSKIGRA